MRHTWQVRRDWIELSEGQQRWDHAYQLLLRWTMAAAVPPDQEEATDEAGSPLCAGVNRAAAASTDD